MKVITESFLRQTFRKEIPGTFRVEEGQILTPSAAQFLNEKSVEIVRGEEKVTCKAPSVSDAPIVESKPACKYVSAGDGGMFETKPEHMTRLYGNRLVPKDHPKIFFRGKLDSLASMILMDQGRAHAGGRNKLVEDLGDVLELVKAIKRSDVTEEALTERTILGLTDSELRNHSQNPKKYFGCDHIEPSFDMGEITLSLNILMNSVREAEVIAVSAYRSEFELEKPDIIQALNKMSRAIYIIMLRENAGKYQ